MPGRFVLTKGELQLMLAVMRTVELHGLEELASTPETRLGEAERNGLVGKKLLVPSEEGRFALDRTTGYLFAGILAEKRYVRGDVLFADGRSARMNLYFADDAFLLIVWREDNVLECTWLPTIPLAMGALVHYLNQPEALLKDSGFTMESEIVPAPGMREALNLAAEAGTEGVKAVLRYELKEADGEPGVNCVAVSCGEDKLYAISGDGLTPASVETLLKPLNHEVLEIHRQKIAEVQDGQNQR